MAISITVDALKRVFIGNTKPTLRTTSMNTASTASPATAPHATLSAEATAKLKQANEISPRGLHDAGPRNVVADLYRPFFDGSGPTVGMSSLIEQRVLGKGLDASPVMSVSELIEASHIAAWSPAKRAIDGSFADFGFPRPGVFSLLELELPTLSVIPMTGPFAPLRHKLGQRGTYLTRSWNGRDEFRLPLDDVRIEQFVFGRRPLSQFHQYEERPPRWFREYVPTRGR